MNRCPICRSPLLPDPEIENSSVCDSETCEFFFLQQNQKPVAMGLTPRQRECLDFIDSFTRENGYGPSYEEIAAGVGLSSKGQVFKVISQLEQRGRIRNHSRARSIEILEAS